MNIPSNLGPLKAPAVLATLILIAWMLNWMAPVLVPIALAILLTFVLSPLITQLQRRGSPIGRAARSRSR